MIIFQKFRKRRISQGETSYLKLEYLKQALRNTLLRCISDYQSAEAGNGLKIAPFDQRKLRTWLTIQGCVSGFPWRTPQSETSVFNVLLGSSSIPRFFSGHSEKVQPQTPICFRSTFRPTTSLAFLFVAFFPCKSWAQRGPGGWKK